MEKGQPTKEVWYVEHPLPEGYKNYSKTKPIRIEEFEIEKLWWNNRVENEYAWKVSIDQIKKRSYNLDFKHPNKAVQEAILSPTEIIEKIKASHQKVGDILKMIEGELRNEKD